MLFSYFFKSFTYFSYCFLKVLGQNSFKTVLPVLENLVNVENIKMVSIMYCKDHNLQDLITIQRQLNHEGAVIHSFYLDNEYSVNNSLSYHEYLCTVVLDLDCIQAEDFLDKVSDLNLFNDSKQFIFVGTNNNSTKNILQKQNININAKITLITPDEYCQNNFKIFQITCIHCKRNPDIRYHEIGQYLNGTWEYRKLSLNYDLGGDIASVGFMVNHLYFISTVTHY